MSLEQTLAILSAIPRKTKILELHEWYSALAQKSPKYLQYPQLIKLMQWKLTIGKYRPQLLKLIQSNSPEDVVSITETAFALPWPASMHELCKLKGVGPATSTAILSLSNDDIPFFSDECATMVLKQDKLKYTAKEVIKYVELMQLENLLLATGLLSISGVAWYSSLNSKPVPISILQKSDISSLPEYPPLTSAQVQNILTSKENTLVPLKSIISKLHFNSVASNNPIEDFHSETHLKNGSVIAIFDGHGGTECADVLSKYLSSYIDHEVAKIPLDDSNRKALIIQALKTSFKRLDSDIINGGIPPVYPLTRQYWGLLPPHADSNKILLNLRPAIAGSCALVAYLENNDLYVACTGDARAVLGRKLQNGSFYALDLSKDQTTANTTEYSRLLDEHPGEDKTVVQKGRILGGLMPTRAFGDARYKWPSHIQHLLSSFGVRGEPRNYLTPPYVIAEPEVTTLTIDPTSDAFMILATDGLWDELSSEEAVACVGKNTETGLNSATGLIKSALGKGDDERITKILSIPAPKSRRYRDDITVSVAFFGKQSEIEELSKDFENTDPSKALPKKHQLVYWLKLLQDIPRPRL